MFITQSYAALASAHERLVRRLIGGYMWNKYPETKPKYIGQQHGERYNCFACFNRNRRLVKVEENPEMYSEGGVYIDVLSFSSTGHFYGYDQTGEGTEKWRQRVIAWADIPDA